MAAELTEYSGQAAEYESPASSTIDMLSDNPSAADIRHAAEQIIHATKALGNCGRVVGAQAR